MDYLAGNVQLVIAIFVEFYINKTNKQKKITKQNHFIIKSIKILSLFFQSNYNLDLEGFYHY